MNTPASEPCPWGEHCPVSCDSCRGTGRVQYSMPSACPECFGTTFTVGVGLADGNREDCRACGCDGDCYEDAERLRLGHPPLHATPCARGDRCLRVRALSQLARRDEDEAITAKRIAREDAPR